MQTIRAHLLRNAAADGKYTNRYRKQRVSKNSLSGVFSESCLPLRVYSFHCIYIVYILHDLLRFLYYRQSHRTLFHGVRFKHILHNLTHKY